MSKGFEVRDYLERVTEPLPVGPAPLREVREAARGRRTRRRWQAVGAGLLATGIAIAGLTLPGVMDRPRDDPAAVEPVSQWPDAGPGMRWVGYGRVVVAVPSSWPTITGPCQRPATDHVYAYSRIVLHARCAASKEPVPPTTVGIGSLERAEVMDLAGDLTETGTVSGVEVLEGSDFCAFGVEGEVCSLRLAVPSEDAFFAITVSGSYPTVDTIRQSLTILPEGYTTVPWVPSGSNLSSYEALVRAAGLAADGGLTVTGTVVEALDPSAGSVVPIGTTVRAVTRRQEPVTPAR